MKTRIYATPAVKGLKQQTFSLFPIAKLHKYFYHSEIHELYRVYQKHVVFSFYKHIETSK